MYIKTLERKCKNLPEAHATHTGLDNALAKRPHAKALNTLSVVHDRQWTATDSAYARSGDAGSHVII